MWIRHVIYIKETELHTSFEGFKKLIIIEFKGSIDKHVNKMVHNTNTYKYKDPLYYSAFFF